MSNRVMWFNGGCVPWEDARIHVWDELALRGANVFEGITAFWDPIERCHRLLAGDQHVSRLFASAKLADIPASLSAGEVFAALAEVARAFPGTDVYLRPTFYAARGRSTLSVDSAGEMYVGGFEFNPVVPAVVRAAVSRHRRFGQPIAPLAKSGGSYLDFRVFERERLSLGVEHVFILNQRGHVAEADGAAILLIGEETVVTPSVGTGVLDSITKRIVLDIARECGYAVTERLVIREELARGQALLAGTLMGLRAVNSIDGVAQADTAATACARVLIEQYAQLCRGKHSLSDHYLTEMPR